MDSNKIVYSNLERAQIPTEYRYMFSQLEKEIRSLTGKEIEIVALEKNIVAND